LSRSLNNGIRKCVLSSARMRGPNHPNSGAVHQSVDSARLHYANDHHQRRHRDPLQGLGSGQPIVFSHGWPQSSDDWDTHMLFFLNRGFRVIAACRPRTRTQSTPTCSHSLEIEARGLAGPRTAPTCDGRGRRARKAHRPARYGLARLVAKVHRPAACRRPVAVRSSGCAAYKEGKPWKSARPIPRWSLSTRKMMC